MTNAGIPPGPLPSRRDGTVPGTPSAAARRNAFTARHPEIAISARREGGRVVYEVSEPGRPAAAYDDGDAMMDDLESRHPPRPAKKTT